MHRVARPRGLALATVVLALCACARGPRGTDPADGDRDASGPDASDTDLPGGERCNDLDDDRDGLVDEGYDLDTDRENCGACGVVCTVAGVRGVPSCGAGSCTETCEHFFGDCDGDPGTGCETPLDTHEAHCGACGRACAAGFGCEAGVCGNDVVAVETGASSTCVLLVAGEVWCWGANRYGQLGDGTTEDRSRAGPVVVAGERVRSFVRLAAGPTHLCAVTDERSVSCWGSGGAHQLGYGDFADRTEPTPTGPVPTAAIQVAAGGAGSAARDETGAVHVWGAKPFAGTVIWDRYPTPMALPRPAVDVAAGEMHAVAVLDDGTVHAWGWNAYGQLGNGTTANSALPVRAHGIADAMRATAGNDFTCVLAAAGKVACWGRNDRQQVGSVGPSAVPRATMVEGIEGAVDVRAGGDHACALLGTGRVACWGGNDHGELGGGTTSRSGPVTMVAGVEGAVYVDAGTTHSCALVATGAVLCWGGNAFGQLGDGTTVDRVGPTPVACLPGHECR